MTDFTLPEIDSFEKTKFGDLWRLWKEYIDCFVVGNREAKQVMFHTVLGVLLTAKGVKYIESTKAKTTRLNCFIIQDAGTGKSELMKAASTMLGSIGCDVIYTTKFNEAALTGTIFLDPLTNKAVERNGALAHMDALFWDEGSVILRQGSADNTTDYLQMVMDEPGQVSKGMRFGYLNYISKTTIVAGSYMFSEFKTTILTRGFLQRMFIVSKVFTEREKQQMRIGVNLLKTIQHDVIVNKIVKYFKNFYDNMELPTADGTITFNKSDVTAFNRNMELLFDEMIAGQYIGDKQRILETFYNRVHTIIDKIAVQRAVINGKKEVDYDDLDYALQLSRLHLDSISNIFDTMMTDEKDISGSEKRKRVIFEIMRRKGSEITQDELFFALMELKKSGLWDLGLPRTTRFIDMLVSSHELLAEVDVMTGKTKIINKR